MSLMVISSTGSQELHFNATAFFLAKNHGRGEVKRPFSNSAATGLYAHVAGDAADAAPREGVLPRPFHPLIYH